MAIERFTAENWEEALRQVRTRFGDNAVILHTKTFKDGGILGVARRSVIEITATDDQSMVAGAAPGANGGSLRAMEEIPAETRKDYSRMLEKAYAIAAARGEVIAASPPPSNVGNSQQRVAVASPAQQTARIVPDDAAGQSTRKHVPENGTSGRRTSDSLREARPGTSGLFKSTTPVSAPSGDNPRIEALMNDVSELKALVAKLATGGADAAAMGTWSAAVQAVHQRLVDHDVSPDLCRKIMAEVNRRLAGSALDDERVVREAVVGVITEMVPIGEPLSLGAGKLRVVAFIGPTGVGKTTTLSKLAANLMIAEKRRIGFITIDTYRLGATEQLRTLANVLNVPMRVVMSPSEMRSVVREMSNMDMIFIDTAGRSHRDRMKMNELKTFLDAASPDEIHLCVPAITHPSHLMSVLDHFGSLNVSRVILTKLDEATTFGPVLEIALRAGRPLSYMTVGQNIPDDIERASGERLARLIFGMDMIDA